MDTYHLFPETLEFLDQKEETYGFKANVFRAEGTSDKDRRPKPINNIV